MPVRYKLVPKLTIVKINNNKLLKALGISSYEIKEMLLQRARHLLAIIISKDIVKFDIRSLELTVVKNIPLMVSIISQIAEEIKEDSEEIRQNADNIERLLSIIKSIVIKHERELADMLIREIKIVYSEDKFCTIIFVVFED